MILLHASVCICDYNIEVSWSGRDYRFCNGVKVMYLECQPMDWKPRKSINEIKSFPSYMKKAYV